MRTDCTIDGKQIVCKNASLIGYSTNRAKVGSFLIYCSGNNAQIARMLGRVTAIDLDTKTRKTWILGMVLTCGAQSACERWIDPLEVMECYDNPPTALAAFFFAPKIPYDAHTMRRLMEHGTIQNQFVHMHADRVAEFKARDAQSKSVRP